MADAPLASTIIAISLIPIACLFLHAFLSGLKGWRFHKITGFTAITWDLFMSLGYMAIRAAGVQVGGSSLEMTGPVLAYFIIHGSIAIFVIALEFCVISTGLWQWKRGKPIKFHGKLAKVLFIPWWIAFLTGEIFYIVVYVL